VRDALVATVEEGTAGERLTQLFRTAVAAGRRARAETRIGTNPATASSLALALAEGVLGELGDRRILVIGAGRIGLQTLKAAQGRGVAQVAIANRTKARAEDVADRFEATAHGLGELEAVLAQADVAVSATSSEEPVVGVGHVRAAMARRAERPLVLVDLAVPGDVEREVADIAGVSLFDVDDLRAGLDDAMTSRLREVPRVEAIVEEEVEDFGRRYRELEVEPLLSELRRQAESIREREVERALRDLGDVDPAVAERMEHLSRTLVKRLLHDPTVRARERAGAGEADEVADAVRDLFGISAPSDQ
jgi:glutamyl-tRNA reductase